MTKITNVDTGMSRDAMIVTEHNNNLHWCIATWAAPGNGWSKVDGNGHGWQVVRAHADGRYTYNNSMLGGYQDSLDDVLARAAKSGYERRASLEG